MIPLSVRLPFERLDLVVCFSRGPREIRDYLRAKDEAELAKVIEGLGKTANLLALAAIEKDPLGAMNIIPGVLAAARGNAIAAQGGGWIVKEMKSLDKSIDAAKRRIHTLERGLIYGLESKGLVGASGYGFGSLLRSMMGSMGRLEEDPFWVNA